MKIAADGARLRVLCLGAHCDDIEIGCGGTLLRLAEDHPGLSVHWAVFSGDRERRAEAEASAADFLQGVADKTLEFLNFDDGYMPWQGALVKREFERLKRSVEPDLVLCHWRRDAHQDHRLIGEMAWNTFRDHLVLEYEIPKYDGDSGNPNLFVPLPRASAERKVSSILHHFASQRRRAWFTAETFQALLRLRGIQCNAASGLAEAFYASKLVV